MFSVRNSGLCASYNRRPKSIQPFCSTLVMFRGNTLKLDAKYSLTTLKTACLCTVFEVVKVFCDLVLLIISASSTPKGKNVKIRCVIATAPNFTMYLRLFPPRPSASSLSFVGSSGSCVQHTRTLVPEHLSFSYSRSAQHAWVSR